jgi:hypothetical protein
MVKNLLHLVCRPPMRRVSRGERILWIKIMTSWSLHCYYYIISFRGSLMTFFRSKYVVLKASLIFLFVVFIIYQLGGLIHTDAYRISLAGATVRIGFTLTHWKEETLFRRTVSRPISTQFASWTPRRITISKTSKNRKNWPGIQLASAAKKKKKGM